MKKSIAVVLILIVTLFSLCGCMNNTENNNVNNSTNSISETKNDNKMIVDGFDLTINKKSSIKDLNFKYPDGGIINSFGTSTLITYVKDKTTDQLLFKILIGNMYGTDVEKVVGGKEFTKVGTKNINGLEWYIYEDSEKNKTYAIKHGGYDIYAIGFVAYGNIGDLEQEFMNNVSFK